MRSRSTAALLLAAAAIVSFIYFFELRGQRMDLRRNFLGQRYFPDLSYTQIDEITFITADGYTASLKRSLDDWKLVEPVAYPADQKVSSALAGALAGLVVEEEIPSPEDLAVYGLGVEAKSIRFRAKGVEHVLRVGKDTPVGGEVYVSSDGASQVSLVNKVRFRSFERLLRDYRDRRVATFQPNRIQWLEIDWPQMGARFERATDGWHVVAPFTAEANSEAIDAMLAELSTLRADTFLDQPTAQEFARLGSALCVLRWGEAEPSDALPTQELRVAGAVADGRLLVRARGKPAMLVRAAEFSTLPQDLNGLRALQLGAFDATDAQRIEVVLRGAGEAGGFTALDFRRVGQVWESDGSSSSRGGGMNTKAEDCSSALSLLLLRLAMLRADSIAAEALGAQERAALGLEPAAIRVRVFGEDQTGKGDEKLLFELRLSDRTLLGGGSLAQVAHREAVYSLSPKSLAALRAAIEALSQKDPAPAE